MTSLVDKPLVGALQFGDLCGMSEGLKLEEIEIYQGESWRARNHGVTFALLFDLAPAQFGRSRHRTRRSNLINRPDYILRRPMHQFELCVSSRPVWSLRLAGSGEPRNSVELQQQQPMSIVGRQWGAIYVAQRPN